MSNSKYKLNYAQFNLNPFSKTVNPNDLYDETREEQVEDLETFVTLNQTVLHKNIYESYKSFFYRYQDYNQINR